MTEVKEVQITLSDLEDVRLVLNAALNFFLSNDLMQAQTQLRANTKSPLTAEIERVKVRMDGYLSDFLLAKYEEGLDLEEIEDEEVVEEEKDAEALSGNPLGVVQVKRQKGRRLIKEEIKQDE